MALDTDKFRKQQTMLVQNFISLFKPEHEEQAIKIYKLLFDVRGNLMCCMEDTPPEYMLSEELLVDYIKKLEEYVGEAYPQK